MMKVKPVFRIFDYAKAVEFYVDWLGFKIDWEHKFSEDAPVYMQVSMTGIMIHLSEHSNSCSPGGHFHIENFEGLPEFHKNLILKNYKFNKPGIGKSSWDEQVMMMEIIDPFRNMMTFSCRT